MEGPGFIKKLQGVLGIHMLEFIAKEGPDTGRMEVLSLDL